jgi:hypothetical protein
MPSDLDVLRAWVAGRASDLPPGGLADDLPLLAGRHLTSLHIPELILLLERLRGGPVDVERLRPGDFADIRTIAARFLPAAGARHADAASPQPEPAGARHPGATTPLDPGR